MQILDQALRELLAQPGGRERLSVVLRYTVMARPELDVQAIVEEFQRVAGSEAGEVVMSTAQELINQGLEQGRRELVALQLTEKFGPLPAGVPEQLEAATADELKLWSLRLLEAGRLEDVFGD